MQQIAVANPAQCARAFVAEAVLKLEAENSTSDLSLTCAFWSVAVERTSEALKVQSVVITLADDRDGDGEIVVLLTESFAGVE